MLCPRYVCCVCVFSVSENHWFKCAVTVYWWIFVCLIVKFPFIGSCHPCLILNELEKIIIIFIFSILTFQKIVTTFLNFSETDRHPTLFIFDCSIMDVYLIVQNIYSSINKSNGETKQDAKPKQNLLKPKKIFNFINFVLIRYF